MRPTSPSCASSLTHSHQSRDPKFAARTRAALTLVGMSRVLSFFGGVLLAGAILGVYVFHLPLALLATVGVAVVCLSWLVVVVVLPWNLHFQAKHLLFEFKRSRARGITVPPESEASAQQVARRMWRVSIALHLGSAALLAFGSWASNEPLGNAFAALFLLSTLFRPAVEYYQYLRRQLSDVLDEVKFPPDDVMKLKTEMEAAKEADRRHQEEVKHLTERLAELETTSLLRVNDANRRLDAVARKFDETLDRLTDNREVISGLRAFLRLVREAPPHPGG